MKSRALLLFITALASCGTVEERPTGYPLFETPRCEEVVAAPFARRAENVTNAIASACGEVAYTESGAGHLVPVESGQPIDLGPTAGYAFTSRGERLLTIDPAGAVVTIVDTKTLVRQSVILDAPIAPAAFGVVGSSERTDQAFWVCSPGLVQIRSIADGHESARHPFSGDCSTMVVGRPRGSGVAFLDGDSVVVLRSDGTSTTIAIDLAHDPKLEKFATEIETWHDGRFVAVHAAALPIPQPKADEPPPRRDRVLVVDTRTLEVVARVNSSNVAHADEGSFVESDGGVVFLAIDGTTRRIAYDATILAAFDPHSVAVTSSGSSGFQIVDAASGALTLSVGHPADNLVISAHGSTIATMERSSTESRSVSVVRGGVERLIGWSNNAELWYAGDDGTVVGTGMLDPGVVPSGGAVSAPSAPANGVFVVRPDGSVLRLPSAEGIYGEDIGGVPIAFRPWQPVNTYEVDYFAIRDEGLAPLAIGGGSAGTNPWLRTRRAAFGAIAAFGELPGALYSGALR